MDCRKPFTALVLAVSLGSASGQDRAEELRHAIWFGTEERVQSLLDAGADPNARYENDYTPIYFATDPKVVDLLIARGAKLDVRTNSGQTPLEHAAENAARGVKGADWKTIVARLRAAGAEYTVDTAIYLNDVEDIKRRLAKDVSWVNRRWFADAVPLRVAARLGRTDICRLLLEHGADPDDFERGGGFPIIRDAVAHEAVVKLLIDHKANLRRRISFQGVRMGPWLIVNEATALHYAVQAGNPESVRLLLAAGLDASAVDSDGQTPLHIAVRATAAKQREAASLKEGRLETAKRMAALEQQIAAFHRIVNQLLASDASLKLRDRQGRTALEVIESIKGMDVMAAKLKKKQAELDEERRIADMFHW